MNEDECLILALSFILVNVSIKIFENGTFNTFKTLRPWFLNNYNLKKILKKLNK